MKITVYKKKVRHAVNSVDYLYESSGLSKTKIKDAMTKGAVWYSKTGKSRRLRRATSVLESGSYISLYYDQAILDRKPIEPEILHIEEDFSIWNKPSGVLCGGTRFGDHCTINRIAERKINKPSFLVHRLDRRARGILVIAHNKNSARSISQQFQERKVKKRYEAIVHNVLEQPCVVDSSIDNKPALSRISPISNDGTNSLISIEIETGRKHQIRRHTSRIGFPIVGDRKYGSTSTEDLKLVSISLGFTHPRQSRQLCFELPKDERVAF